jgi:hypothetical protein
MRRKIEIDDVDWAALKFIAAKMRYTNRQKLLRKLVVEFVKSHSEITHEYSKEISAEVQRRRGMREIEVLMGMDEESQELMETVSAPTEEDIAEIIGDDLLPETPEL